MMQTSQIVSALTALLISVTSYATPLTVNELKTAREQVLQQYVRDLQNADYKDITALFEKNGTVISTSHGEVDAKTFYYSFLSNVSSAATEIHQMYNGDETANVMAVRFHFTYAMKDGEKGSGEYIDEFTFTSNSAKLTNVYMFENLT